MASLRSIVDDENVATDLMRQALRCALAGSDMANDADTDDLLAAARTAGRTLALRHLSIARRLPGSNRDTGLLEQIAAAAGMKIEPCESEGGWPGRVVFADYQPGNKLIRLYLPALRLLEAVLQEHDALAWFGRATGSAVYLAHELYHHFDTCEGLTGSALAAPGSCAPWLTGRWRLRMQAACAEIAAGDYAQALLALPEHPIRIEHLAAKSNARP